MVSDSPVKILFFPFMAQGHMLPMVDMAKLFAARGVHSAMFTTPTNAALIQPSINGHILVKLLIVPFPTYPGLPQGMEMVSQVVSQETRLAFIQAVDLLRIPFDQIVKEFQPDCIITDMFLPWTCDVAEENGVPRVMFHGTNAFSRCCFNSMDRNKILENLPPEAEYVEIPGLPHDIKLLKSQTDVSRTLNPARGELFKKIGESEARSYGVVVNSFYELEPDYADHYRNVVGRKAWHVGPVSLCNTSIVDKSGRGHKASIDGDECVNWLDRKSPRSVVYVCFGSMAEFSGDQIRELALGLEASNHPFIWVVRKHYEDLMPEGFEERTQGRALIIKGWAPQILILNHRAVGCSVTHCGWNSSLEAISAGLPLVTWPMFAEQFFNEKLIVDILKIGVAVGVRKYALLPEEREVIEATRVTQAVEEIMGGGQEAEERRSKAEEMGKMARRAVENGGSSYVDMGNLMQELMDRRRTIG